jgi:hypothetical protein
MSLTDRMLIYITEVVTDDIDLQKGDELWYARYVCYNCGLSLPHYVMVRNRKAITYP